MKTKIIFTTALLIFFSHVLIHAQNEMNKSITKYVNGKEYYIEYDRKYNNVRICDIMNKGQFVPMPGYNTDYFGSVQFERDFRPNIKALLSEKQKEFIKNNFRTIKLEMKIDTNNENLGILVLLGSSIFDITGKDKNKLSLEDVVRIKDLFEKEKRWVSRSYKEKHGYVIWNYPIHFD